MRKIILALLIILLCGCKAKIIDYTQEFDESLAYTDISIEKMLEPNWQLITEGSKATVSEEEIASASLKYSTLSQVFQASTGIYKIDWNMDELYFTTDTFTTNSYMSVLVNKNFIGNFDKNNKFTLFLDTQGVCNLNAYKTMILESYEVNSNLALNTDRLINIYGIDLFSQEYSDDVTINYTKVPLENLKQYKEAIVFMNSATPKGVAEERHRCINGFKSVFFTKDGKFYFNYDESITFTIDDLNQLLS